MLRLSPSERVALALSLGERDLEAFRASRRPPLSRNEAMRDPKVTNRPSAEIEGRELKSLPWPPPESTDTRDVFPVVRSWTKMSRTALLSAATRLVAIDWKATNRPFAEIAGATLSLFA